MPARWASSEERASMGRGVIVRRLLQEGQTGGVSYE